MADDQLLTIASAVATQAAELARSARAAGVNVTATKSTPVDIVTQADRDTEGLIRALIADARPDDGFLGEESTGTTGTSGLTWIVDPIDGTVNYLYGIPHYAVSIAVVEGEPDPQTWRALAGCVVNPATGELFTATAGGGAFLGSTSIRVAQPVKLSTALIGTGFAYASEMRAHQGGVIAQLLPHVRDIRRLGTASLDLCFVASGRLNAYFERTLSPWDHAAGTLIAREAGATVKGWGDTEPDSEFILAAQPDLVASLESVLRELGY